ncbi:MAG: LD-carboxypeptidase [Clostridia bacterium]|nr:LD-carboxypeptidase [Clostridia bacterium]
MCYTGTGLVKPARLEKGDTLGLIAPSGVIRDMDALDEAVAFLEGMGYRVKTGESCLSRYGYLSGSDDVRARDVNRMFADAEVKAVICLKGGYGTPRILDRLDYDAISRHPKLFSGYSDITAMHLALFAKCGLCTLHAPMPAYGVDGESLKSIAECLSGATVGKPLVNIDGSLPVCVNPGEVEAPLIGGNLSLIATVAGSEYMPDVSGRLLFIEDVSEYTYAIDRMLTRLRLLGVFEKCAGVIFGSFEKCESEYPDRALGIDQIIADVVAGCKKPIISSLRAGHCRPSLCLGLGIRYHLDATRGELTPLESLFHD